MRGKDIAMNIDYSERNASALSPYSGLRRTNSQRQRAGSRMKSADVWKSPSAW